MRFLATPQSVNAVIGTQALFNCTASEVIAISWLVNEKSVQGSELADLGINAIPTILGPDDVRQSILTIMVDAEFDNATIQCIVIDNTAVYQNHPSDTATLTVKGTHIQKTTCYILCGCCHLSCEKLIVSILCLYK